MSLLVMIALGMLSLSTIELRASQNGRAQAEAKANARMALMIAIGELQKTMGPDQRISARAETMALHPQLGIAASDNPAAPNTPKSWWVGASHSDLAKGIIDSDMAAGPNNPSVVWLVSGLDPTATPQAQIASAQPFETPVTMYGDKSIDMAAFTGGKPIEAGLVNVMDTNGNSTGGYAYLIDDNGMKAQLAASNPKVRNDLLATGGVLPGTYNLSILQDMGDLAVAEIGDYGKLGSTNDLPLLGADISVSKAKRLGYTARSRGVLSDVRKGGLKKDLTIAFENDQVFTAVFGNSSSGFAEKYIVMDPVKFAGETDLVDNGYIHWEMFKDYYNTKKHIISNGNDHYLDTFLISKDGILWNAGNGADLFGRGQLGPHQIGNNDQTHLTHKQMPYGNYQAMTAPAKKDGSPSLTEYYKHSPVIPILSRLQQNAWLDISDDESKIKLRSQMWLAQYNPYNIVLNVVGDDMEGPRVISFPQVKFTVEGIKVAKSGEPAGVNIKNRDAFHTRLQTHVGHPTLLGAGRSHFSAYTDEGGYSDTNDSDRFGDDVKDLVLTSIYREYDLISVTAPVKLTVDFTLGKDAMMHGAGSDSGNNPDHEVAQTMWAPFAWDMHNHKSQPGKRIVVDDITKATLNENNMASFSFHLRTTREGTDSIRPLIDANIRAIMCNTKWDSPLGVDLLAGYSAANQGETDDHFPQMHTDPDPEDKKGYSYLGAGNDAQDGHDRVILFDIPREDLISLGQLQHAGVGRFSYEPTYITGNSYANPRIPLDDWKASISDTFSKEERGLKDYVIPGKFNIYDASYLVNEELWDSYIFTTIPQVADNYSTVSEDPTPSDTYFEAVLAGEKLLPNPRFLPYEPTGSTFNLSTLQMSSSSGSETGAFYHNAGHLLVDGAFNVNSTSVDAWEAFLSGTHKLPYQKMDANGLISGFSPVDEVKGVRFPRVKSVFGEGVETDALDENFWVGFRDLKQEEVRALAVAIVDEVKKRGPFLTFGDFVNRRLESGELGQRGALQAALDITVNKELDNDFGEDATHTDVPGNSTQGAGFPGQLLQGDILQALSPYMTVRSDTFTIRAYGESRNTSSNRVEARAWCEAVIQRSPDPCVAAGSTAGDLEELANPSSKFGRILRIVSFRWLNQNEI